MFFERYEPDLGVFIRGTYQSVEWVSQTELYLCVPVLNRRWMELDCSWFWDSSDVTRASILTKTSF